jgi:hypothetical protein
MLKTSRDSGASVHRGKVSLASALQTRRDDPQGERSDRMRERHSARKPASEEHFQYDKP